MKNNKFRRDDLSPMLKQCLATQDEYPDCILFYILRHLQKTFHRNRQVCKTGYNLDIHLALLNIVLALEINHLF